MNKIFHGYTVSDFDTDPGMQAARNTLRPQLDLELYSTVMPDETRIYLAVRREKLADLGSGDTAKATRALLYLTYEDPDRKWLEELLLNYSREGNDPQLRSLAVTCMGHIGRMRGVVGSRVASALEDLLLDEHLGGVAEDALGDIRHFAQVE